MESNLDTNDRPMTGGVSSVLGDGCTSGSKYSMMEGMRIFIHEIIKYLIDFSYDFFL